MARVLIKRVMFVSRHYIVFFKSCSKQAYSGVGSLAARRFKFTESNGKFNSNSNGADTAYICKHSECPHTQKCTHNVSTEITLVSQQE